jgi:hypothetical protein
MSFSVIKRRQSTVILGLAQHLHLKIKTCSFLQWTELLLWDLDLQYQKSNVLNEKSSTKEKFSFLNLSYRLFPLLPSSVEHLPFFEFFASKRVCSRDSRILVSRFSLAPHLQLLSFCRSLRLCWERKDSCFLLSVKMRRTRLPILTTLSLTILSSLTGRCLQLSNDNISNNNNKEVKLKETFSRVNNESHILRPGDRLSLKCVATGSPLPTITWTLDSSPIPETHRIQYGDYVR